MQLVRWFDEITMLDLPSVGGKNASLGEMISKLSDLGVTVPGGFATTSAAFRDFLSQSGLGDRIHARLEALNTEDVNALHEAGTEIRRWVTETPFQPELDSAIDDAWERLCEMAGTRPSVAVRSSATAEDRTATEGRVPAISHSRSQASSMAESSSG